MPACLTCLQLEDEFLSGLQTRVQPEMDQFVARHPEHAEPLRVALRDWVRIHQADLPQVLQPPAALKVVLTLHNNAQTLGTGGQAEVHSYADPLLRGEVAVKFPRGDNYLATSATRRDEIQRQFLREAQITSRLNHPGVTPIYAHGVYESAAGSGGTATDSQAAPGWPFYVMRRIQGHTWDERVAEFYRQGGLPTHANPKFRALLDSFRQACQTMAHAHHQNVVHRDLKPANLLLDDNGVTTVLDWGVARLMDEPVEEGAVSFIGTLACMAPEQAAGRSTEIDHRSDVYGLGALLFYLLSGESPHEHWHTRASLNLKEARRKVATSPTPRASSRDHRVSVPAELVSICARAMAFRQADRYQSAAELDLEIASWLARKPVLAHAYTWPERGTRWLREHVAALAVSLVVLLAVAVIGGLSSYSQAAARLAEQQRRVELEEHQLEIETLLTQRELEAGVNLLKTGAPGSKFGAFPERKSTSSWDTQYVLHAMTLRPRAEMRFAAVPWGVIAADYFPRTGHIAVAAADGELAIWDVRNQTLVRQLVTPVFDEGLRKTAHYGTPTTKVAAEVVLPEYYTGVAWIGDGKELVVATLSGKGLAFNVATGKSHELFTAKEALLALAVQPGGDFLLFGDAAGRVYRRAVGGKDTTERLVAAKAGTAITCLLWHEPLSAWVVGDASGRVQLLHGETLESIATTSLSGPIWALAATVHDKSTLLAAAGSDGQLAVWSLLPESPRFGESSLLQLTRGNDPALAAHALRFSAAGNKLWAIDHRGFLQEWDLARRQMQWSVSATAMDSRRQKLEQEDRDRTPPRTWPLPYRRVAAAIFATGPQSLIAAGDDGHISLWNVPENREALLWGTKVYALKCGAKGRLVFSKQPANQLWIADDQAVLTVLDATTGQQMARKVKVHSTGITGLARFADGVATAGLDNEIRFWKLAAGKIVSARPAITHDHPVLSVTVSADDRWLAAVDVQSGVSVWNINTGERQLFDKMSGSSVPPLTGDIHFDAQTTYLAAYGAAQSGAVYACREQAGKLLLTRQPDQINVAGKQGGTALAWNPAWPGRIVHADDYPRLFIRSYGADRSRPASGEGIEATVVDIVTTPDGRRLLWADRNGQIGSLDTRHELPMIQFQSSLGDVCGLALDDRGQQLAVVNQAGSVEIWQTERSARYALPKPIDRSGRWQETELVQRSSATLGVAPRTLRLNSRGEVAFLAVETQVGDFRNDGALFYLAEESGQVTREQITSGSPEFDRRMEASACGLALFEDRPMVVFRCRTAKGTHHDGQLLFSRRTRPGVWQREVIHEQDNQGFYPALVVNSSGELTDIFHFAFHGYYLRHSFRQNGEWKYKLSGNQGDGFNLASNQVDDKLHLLSRVNRFNGDALQAVYLSWSKGAEQPTRERIPATLPFDEKIGKLPNGQPIVMQIHPSADFQNLWFNRTNTGWKKYAHWPGGLTIQGWEVGPQGEIYVATWNPSSRELVLWRCVDEQWTGEIVSRNLPEAPNVVQVRINPKGQPVLIVGRIWEPFGWLKALRK